MKAGARNRILAKVVSVKSDDIMSLAKFQTEGPVEMASVLTTESVRALDLQPGDRVELLVKAVHVLVVKP